MLKSLFGRAAIAGLALSLLSGVAAAQSLTDKIKSGEIIRVGFANEAPFSSANANGELVGSDIALLRATLAKMGVKEFDGVLTPFGSLIPGLKAKRFDIIAAGLYIRPDRCKQVAFAEPIFAVGDAIVVPAGNPKKLASLGDFAKNAALKLGYTTGAGALIEHAYAVGVPKEQVSALPDGPALIAAVKAGRIDAFLYPSLSAQELLKAANDPAVERAEPFTQPVVNGKPALGVGSFAVRTDDAEFLKTFNETMLSILNSPEYLQMIEPFGFSKADLPPAGMTTAELCKG
ncbi:ectoine/hydroxyectoine ABC transporter substrate-binding protein EhuB [Ancylobacter terrae]|uniref:ectoine/hydroxyectoine ABC transporter substrate-binding protein EhuB n=1 Tax=Ancylobacter sp. sgz301288 TaxID=3342077 RepID=UPI003858502E